MWSKPTISDFGDAKPDFMNWCTWGSGWDNQCSWGDGSYNWCWPGTGWGWEIEQ